MNGGTTFKCTFCEYRVNIVDFNSTNGNRRTQATAVVDQHAASLHLQTVSAVTAVDEFWFGLARLSRGRNDE
jgi:hypothetical protein